MRLPVPFPLMLACLVASAQPPATPARAQALVRKAIAYARTHGLEALFRQTNEANGTFNVGSGGEMYLFVYDEKGVCKAIGFNAAVLVGKNRIDLRDSDGKAYLQEMIRVARTQGRGWVDYRYPDPVTGRVVPKTSYVEWYEGLLFGCGVYRR